MSVESDAVCCLPSQIASFVPNICRGDMDIPTQQEQSAEERTSRNDLTLGCASAVQQTRPRFLFLFHLCHTLVNSLSRPREQIETSQH
jgi:hypothetical protein